MAIVPLGLSVLEIVGWVVWVIVALLASIGSLAAIASVREGLWPQKPRITVDEFDDVGCSWSIAIICLFWWVILVLFFIEDWEKLHVLWLAPVSGYVAAILGEKIADWIVPQVPVNVAIQSVAKRVWRAHLTEGRFVEEVRRACANEGIPLNHFTLSKSLSESRELSREEVGSLLKNCEQDAGPEGPRDGAIIVLLYGYGLARIELVSLTMNDYNPESETLVVESPGVWMETLRKVEIRRLERSRPLIISIENVIDWLKVRGHDPGPFFCQIGKDGTLYPSRPITATKVYHILKTRGEQAGIHPFRATSFRTIGTTTSWTEAFTSSKGAVLPLALKCPGCGSIIPPSGVRCDCGYNFQTKQFELESTWVDPFPWL